MADSSPFQHVGFAGMSEIMAGLIAEGQRPQGGEECGGQRDIHRIASEPATPYDPHALNAVQFQAKCRLAHCSEV